MRRQKSLNNYHLLNEHFFRSSQLINSLIIIACGYAILTYNNIDGLCFSYYSLFTESTEKAGRQIDKYSHS